MPDHQQATADANLVEKMSHERYLRAGRSSRSRVKIMLLAICLAVTLLILLVVSIYSASKISSLSGEKTDIERQLITVEAKIEALNPQLTQARLELNELVQNRFPNLHELKINNMMEVNQGLIKQVVFTKIKQGNRDVYKYLVVAENSAVKKINPSFRVLLFDEFGVHVANADVVDKRVLEPGESRDYTDELELIFDSLPKHFYIEDLSGHYNTGNK
ncbi:MAG: hypothetical protein V7745_05735 [Pseudomonadales bacterium]